MIKFLLAKDTWQEIFDSLSKNKLRSVLTMVGVWWGILLLIGLLGSAKGIENNFNIRFQNYATNSVFIFSGRTTIPFKGYQEGRIIKLRLSDVEKIKENVDGVEYVLPSAQTQTTLNRKTLKGSFTGRGEFPFSDNLRKKDLVWGRYINQNDIDERKKVIVISEDVYKQLFEKGENPIGKLLNEDKVSFTVIGVYKVVNLGGPQIDFDIPYTTAQQIYNLGDNVTLLTITGKPEYDINQIDADVKLLLKNIHNIHPDDNRALNGFNLGDRFEQFRGFLIGMQFLTWFVGIATLIAGVFAIGGILLISVKERTNEIGIRRALGATPYLIKRQIIVEAVAISLISGLLGIISGGLILIMLNSFVAQGEDAFMRNPSVSIGMVFLALLIVIVLGTLIGLIPAFKATSVKPIDALREE
ncbi:putative ABC transport system permease protein [Hyunsoonleella jejuensis]|uniref:Putative ABC transport system permease protein n=1 Tax=Hyunsoonleella jejuensis TaxID=419940 RepID=A0A1H9AAF1_9FLAO|nr:ABC transporter permease [Hyunsoonleella jejuensis]SEP73726.1 putative ABC transport system permease protein [Hyunsoonleella jejuensis]